MGPDLCIDRGLSLAQWLKLIEEIEPQPPCCEISEAKYTFIAILFFFVNLRQFELEGILVIE